MNGNGNKFKGNNQKKGRKGKKEVFADFNENTDQYGKVTSIQGGKHISVLLLNDPSKVPVHTTLRGIHHKRLWLRPDDLVIVRGNGNLYEIWGKVPDSDVNRIKREFCKKDGDDNSSGYSFREKNDDLPEEDDDDDNKMPEGGYKKEDLLPKKNVVVKVPDQPTRSYNDEIFSDGGIDFDKI